MIPRACSYRMGGEHRLEAPGVHDPGGNAAYAPCERPADRAFHCEGLGIVFRCGECPAPDGPPGRSWSPMTLGDALAYEVLET